MDASPRLNAGPHRVALGTWSVDEVQLCEMGSKDADGVYKSTGSISLC
jgi:activating signal cointegrator complex subunit 1